MQSSLLHPVRNVGVDFAVTVPFNAVHSGSLSTVSTGTVPQDQDQTPLANSGLSTCIWMILLRLLADYLVLGGILCNLRQNLSYCRLLLCHSIKDKSSKAKHKSRVCGMTHIQDIHFPVEAGEVRGSSCHQLPVTHTAFGAPFARNGPRVPSMWVCVGWKLAYKVTFSRVIIKWHSFQ